MDVMAGPTVKHWFGWTVFSLPFGYGRCFPFLLCVCVTPTLFVLFASVFAVLSALSLSLYSFFSVSIFPPRSLNSASYSAQFIAGPSPFSTCIDSPSLLFSDVVLTSYPFTHPRSQSYCILYIRV